MKREEVLDAAKEIVTGSRQQEYGKPENNFEIIAQLWSVYKGVIFSAHEVAMMMALLKVARIRNGGGSGDSYVDLCGYASIAAEIHNSEKKEE